MKIIQLQLILIIKTFTILILIIIIYPTIVCYLNIFIYIVQFKKIQNLFGMYFKLLDMWKIKMER